MEVTAEWDASSVTVTITDDGPGFRPEIIDNLGEPYVTTRFSGTKKRAGSSGSGMGLGFFIAKSLLERSGATLAFENQRLPRTGAIAAVLVYFFKDIVRIVAAWVGGLVHAEGRGSFDYRFGWFIIWGSLPIAVIGFLARDLISGSLRSLWVVGTALIAWSAVMVFAEKRATQVRKEQQTTLVDVLVDEGQPVRLFEHVDVDGTQAVGGQRQRDPVHPRSHWPGAGIGPGRLALGRAHLRRNRCTCRSSW